VLLAVVSGVLYRFAERPHADTVFGNRVTRSPETASRV